MSSKKPIHEIRLGRIKAAVWENETDSGIRYGVTLSRLYTEREGRMERIQPASAGMTSHSSRRSVT